MKNLFRLFALLIISVSAVAFVGCSDSKTDDPTPPAPAEASAKIKSVTADITSATVVMESALCSEYAYQLLAAGAEAPVNETILWATATEAGKTGTLKDGENTIVLSDVLSPNTEYVLYMVVKTNENKFLGEILSKGFKTAELDDVPEGVTLVEQLKDGFVLSMNFPEETEARLANGESAVRWNTADIFTFYTRTVRSGATDMMALLTNGNDGKEFTESTVITIDDFNSIHRDENDDPIYISDGMGGEVPWIRYGSLVPGQKNYFISGEFKWGECEYFGGWGEGWFDPMFDMDQFLATGGNDRITGDVGDGNFQAQFWSGFYSRDIFQVKPALPFEDAEIDFEISDKAPNNATVTIVPGDNIGVYAYYLTDHSEYLTFVNCLQGDASNLQWFLTSEAGAMESVRMSDQPVQFTMDKFFYADAIAPGVVYHLLITAAAEDRVSQKFYDYQFTLPDYSLEAPNVVVTEVAEKCTSDLVVYNVKVVNGVGSYGRYCIGYEDEWQDMLGKGAKYSDIVKMDGYGYPFDNEDVLQMNTEEGLEISLPSKSNALNRLAVLVYNSEGLSNAEQLDSPNSTAVCDARSKSLPAEDRVETDLYTALNGDWTASAQVVESVYDQNEGRSHWELVEEPVISKVTIGNGVYCPESYVSVEAEMKKVYSPGDYGKLEGYYNEFAQLAVAFNTELSNRNRLLCSGFDFYDYSIYNGAMTWADPWDLMMMPNYSSTISSMFHDFGPKWYLHIEQDGSLTMQVNPAELGPITDWYDSYTYHMIGWDYTTNYYVVADPNDGGYVNFPVEVSEDRNTIVIKACVLGGITYYPTVAIFTSGQYSIDTVVASEITLTRGWNNTAATTSTLSTKSRANTVPVSGVGPEVVIPHKARGVRSTFSAEIPVYEQVTFEAPTAASAAAHARQFSPYVRR